MVLKSKPEFDATTALEETLLNDVAAIRVLLNRLLFSLDCIDYLIVSIIVSFGLIFNFSLSKEQGASRKRRLEVKVSRSKEIGEAGSLEEEEIGGRESILQFPFCVL